MQIRNVRAVAFASLVAVFAVGCGGSTGGTDAGTDAGTDPVLVCDTGAATVNSAKVFADVIETKCKSCHVANATGFAYGDYTDADKFYAGSAGAESKYKGSAGTLKIVEANKLANSSLWLKVNGGSPSRKGPNNENVGAKMPQDGMTLTDAQLKAIKDWICTGATK